MPRQFYVKGKRILAYARPEGDRRGVTARFAAKKGGGRWSWSWSLVYTKLPLFLVFTLFITLF